MKERPILFSAPMVQAILEGRKTQTRRMCKPGFSLDMMPSELQEHYDVLGWVDIGGFIIPPCPHGQVGDQLWVREKFKVSAFSMGYQNENNPDDFECPTATVNYAFGASEYRELIQDAEMGIDDVSQAKRAFSKSGWSPSIHMPRWASRIQLEITGIRVERLQDISEEDADKEGVEMSPLSHSERTDFNGCQIKAFEKLWTSINGAVSWKSNPWVWVVEFIKL